MQAEAMYHYRVFGGCLRSDTELPLLGRTQAAVPDWTLRSASPPPPAAGTLLGEAPVQKGVGVRLFRLDSGFRLEYDDTGTFDIIHLGSEIVWYHDPSVSIHVAQIDIFGRVLATALHASGTLCLHGSGVAFEAGGIALLAPKFHGKSTLAHALVGAGARLATDDVVPVQSGEPPLMRPGMPQVRLWRDSAERLAPERLGSPPEKGQKYCVTDLPDAALLTESVPLAAIYLLQPMEPGTQGQPAVRVPVNPVEALMSILKNTTLAPLLGGTEAATLFRRAHDIVAGVPAYQLRYVRDFELLPRVVEQLIDWHAPRDALVGDA